MNKILRKNACVTCVHHILKTITDFVPAQGMFIAWKALLLIETLT